MNSTKKPNSTRSHSTRSLKENIPGTGGIFEEFHPGSLIPKIQGTHGNEWERVGTGEPSIRPKPGLFFHSIDADGEIEHQGYLLELTPSGYGRAQLFEWFWGEQSRVIEVTPDYLRQCVFYTSCKAMNAAYAESEVCHE